MLLKSLLATCILLLATTNNYCANLAFEFFSAFFAVTVEVERVVRRYEGRKCAVLYGAPYFLIRKFAHCAAPDADAVVMCGTAGYLFVFGVLRIELVFDHQTARHQQFERVVNRGAAHTKLLRGEFYQRIGRKVRRLRIDQLQQTETLLRAA